jgi:hypothetical protein
MNPQDVAPMIVFTTLIVVSGGVILLRPLTRRLGDLIEVIVAERRRHLAPPEPAADRERVVNIVESLEQRLRHLEERQDFTDSLLTRDPRSALKDPAGSAIDRR